MEPARGQDRSLGQGFGKEPGCIKVEKVTHITPHHNEYGVFARICIVHGVIRLNSKCWLKSDQSRSTDRSHYSSGQLVCTVDLLNGINAVLVKVITLPPYNVSVIMVACPLGLFQEWHWCHRRWHR